MTWNWNPRRWKRSTKLLLGFATAWPYVYLILFFVAVLGITLFLKPNRLSGFCGDTGVAQLEQKIRNGEIRELVIKSTEILARSRSGNCEYRVAIRNEYQRRAILRAANELDANREPLVPRISHNDAPPVSPIAVVYFIVVFVAHMLTIVLLLGLITIYVVLAIKNEQFDQTMKIAWVVGFGLVTMVAMPVYYYLYVWRKPPVASPGWPPQMSL